jgi:hypothetical protein
MSGVYAGIFSAVVVAVMTISLTVNQGEPVSENWAVLGDHWGGNSRARDLVGIGQEGAIYFPLHDDTHGDGVLFTMAHRCPENCLSGFTTTCTNERQLSNSIFAQGQSPAIDPNGLSAWSVFFGQFMDHDITMVRKDEVFCTIDMTDLGAGVEPLKIRRTRVAAQGEGGCRDPVLFITPYIDGGVVYSDYVNPDRAARLREFALGRIKVTPDNFLPRDPEKPNEYLAGDERATEHAALALLHTLFARQHNQLAHEIHLSSTNYNDEQLFWKARRLLVAQLQRIAYEEYLPALLGNLYQRTAFGMMGVEEACSTSHGSRGTTVMKTEFAQAAYRFGHSTVPDQLGPFSLVDLFFNATLFEQIGVEPLVEALQGTAALRADAKVVDTLRNMLFGTHGMDLVALNIARGRELGVAGYDSTAMCYDDAISPPSRRTPATQDLFVRLLQEPLAAGSSVSNTLGKIIASQFLDLCRNDPFFYTREQTQRDIGRRFYPWVEGATLKGVIVNNTSVEPSSIPENAFFVQ